MDTNECIDVDECSSTDDERDGLTNHGSISKCHDSAICTNLIGSVICECPAGLFGDGFLSCDDFDECSQVSSNL